MIQLIIIGVWENRKQDKGRCFTLVIVTVLSSVLLFLITAFELYFQSSGLKDMSLPTIIAALTKTNSTVVEDKENRITEYEANIELSGVGGSERGSESSKPSKSFLNFVSNPLSQNNSVRESERGSESNKPPPKSFLNFITNPVLRNDKDLDDNDDAPRFTLSTGTGSLNVSDSVVNQTSKTVQFAEHHDAYQISFGNDSVLNQNYGSDSQAQRDSVHKVNVRKE